jgi:aryl-alcohol dehydrogenase-like predicted oxidoreductase
MRERNLGRSGLRVSAVGLGGNNFGGRVDENGTREIVHAALDAGITFFDTADTYGKRGGGQSGASELFLGAALGARRKDIVLATKFGHALDPEMKKKGASRSYMITAVEASLRRLKTDWIDLYQLHGPDPLTPIDETMRTFDDLVRSGKVRYVGCSNLPAWRVVDAVWTAREHGLHTFISCQDEYSLVNRSIETDVIPAAKIHGLGILPFYPLASGLLTGKYKAGEAPPEGSRFAKPERFERRFQTDSTAGKIEPLRAFAEQRGHSLLELAFSWLAGRDIVGSVMAGATSPAQIKANATAADWQLSPEDYAEIDKITLG